MGKNSQAAQKGPDARRRPRAAREAYSLYVERAAERVCLWYGDKPALKDITMSIPKHRITAYIGPSGCGKSTLLRCLNRMNDLVDGVKITGSIRIGGTDIYDPGHDVTDLRKRVGMVFQKSNPFPKSIFENVAYGPRILGVTNRSDFEA